MPELTTADGPIAPEGQSLDHSAGLLYNQASFTLPAPVHITKSDLNDRLDKLLGEASPQQLAVLDSEATAGLPDLKRPQNRVDIGFFPQGIVTGLVIMLTVVVTVTGATVYFLRGYLHQTRQHSTDEL